jgi:hypothetical protein
MRTIISTVVALALLSGCAASDGTLADLENARWGCSTGNLAACNSIPYVAHKADEEARARTSLLILLPLLPLLILSNGR